MGAESTGKSTLTQRLARELGTKFVPEYGRYVWEQKNGQLVPSDYVRIAAAHRAMEDQVRRGCNRYMIVDTNAITTMFFSYYYGRTGLPQLTQLAEECKGRYDCTLLCADDIPFEQDGWRDNAEWRARVQGMVMYDLTTRGIPWTVLTGSLEQRIRMARDVLSRIPPRTLSENPS